MIKEERFIQIPNGAKAVVAEYKEQFVQEYKGNAFIEALPNIMEPKQIAQSIISTPVYSEEERLYDTNIRFHLIQRLFQFFMPLPIHLDIESSISRIIRQSYVRRNPFSPEYAKQFYASVDIANVNYLNSSTSDSLVIIGPSGIGKSSTLNRLLHMYPQVISHSNYKGRHLMQYQVVWIKCECSHDGGIKGIIASFFRSVDSAVGSNYYEKFIKNSRYSANALLTVMSKVARSINLGVLIIDEVQNLQASRSGGAEKMLNFFVGLINELSLPIVMVGTPKALGIFQNEFRSARRGSGQGSFIWDRMKQDGYWELFLQKLWGYQWTKHYTPLTQELSNTLFSLSQGIPDLLIKLFAMSQIRAISSNKEKIDISIVNQVFQERFKLLQPMMNALNSGDLYQMAKVEDIYIPPIHDFVKNETAKVNLDAVMNMVEQVSEQKSNMQQIKQEALLRLQVLGIDEHTATRYFETFANEGFEIDSVEQVVKKIVSMWVASSNVKGEETVVKQKNNEFKVHDYIKNGYE